MKKGKRKGKYRKIIVSYITNIQERTKQTIYQNKKKKITSKKRKEFSAESCTMVMREIKIMLSKLRFYAKRTLALKLFSTDIGENKDRTLPFSSLLIGRWHFPKFFKSMRKVISVKVSGKNSLLRKKKLNLILIMLSVL